MCFYIKLIKYNQYGLIHLQYKLHRRLFVEREWKKRTEESKSVKKETKTSLALNLF